MKNVVVLLSTYNGEKYLEEQINSLLLQVGVKVQILVRDDGSTDSTKDLLRMWEKKGILSWYEGENLKPARSFLDLMKNAPNSDYYAFCDQDDIWDRSKLLVAINNLEKFNDKMPSLYFSKAQLVDENLKNINSNNYPKKEFSFGASMVRNNVTGCTVVFNKELLNIVNKYNPNFIMMHDQWIYLICKAFNGNIFFDSNSYIKYRQHSSNCIGGKRDIKSKIKENSLISKENTRYKQAINILEGYGDEIYYENKKILYKIKGYKKNFFTRISLAFDKRMYTFTRYDILFALSCLLGKY